MDPKPTTPTLENNRLSPEDFEGLTPAKALSMDIQILLTRFKSYFNDNYYTAIYSLQGLANKEDKFVMEVLSRMDEATLEQANRLLAPISGDDQTIGNEKTFRDLNDAEGEEVKRVAREFGQFIVSEYKKKPFDY